MKRKDKKAKKIEQAIKLVYSSLKSHLPWAYSKDKKFHKKCTKEYSKVIRLLTKLY